VSTATQRTLSNFHKVLITFGTQQDVQVGDRCTYHLDSQVITVSAAAIIALAK